MFVIVFIWVSSEGYIHYNTSESLLLPSFLRRQDFNLPFHPHYATILQRAEAHAHYHHRAKILPLISETTFTDYHWKISDLSFVNSGCQGDALTREMWRGVGGSIARAAIASSAFSVTFSILSHFIALRSEEKQRPISHN